MMTGEDFHGTTANRPRPGLRTALLLTPLFLLVASVALLVAAPFAWGAADIIDVPGWMPSFVGALIAGGGLALGMTALLRTLRVTRGDFETHPLQTAAGVIIIVTSAISLISLAMRIGDADTYTSAIDDHGEVTISPAVFLIGGLLLGIFTLAWCWVGTYLYGHAVADLQPNRISERHPGEVDGVGELLRERS